MMSAPSAYFYEYDLPINGSFLEHMRMQCLGLHHGMQCLGLHHGMQCLGLHHGMHVHFQEQLLSEFFFFFFLKN